mmetsp:Transcript_3979/g.8744  ORF Transcript_3979/g.8744 Transcript_3979/m.8744 type:complete len:85 (+) Transcript_3979:632-886(+)
MTLLIASSGFAGDSLHRPKTARFDAAAAARVGELMSMTLRLAAVGFAQSRCGTRRGCKSQRDCRELGHQWLQAHSGEQHRMQSG